MARVNFLEGKLGNDAINLYEDMIKTKRLNHLSNMYVISEGMVAGGNVLSNIVLNKALVEYGHRLARPSDIEKSVSRGFTVHPYSFDVGFQVFDMEEGMAPYMRSLVDSVKDMGGKSPSIVPSSDLEFFVQDNKFQLNICDESFKEETRLFNDTGIKKKQYSKRFCIFSISNYAEDKDCWIFYNNLEAHPVKWDIVEQYVQGDIMVSVHKARSRNRILVTKY